MARYVVISNVSCLPRKVDPQLSPADRVPIVIDHLRERIGQVLPDKPDLIVLPEVSDRAEGGPKDRELTQAYYRARGTRVLDMLRELAARQKCYIVYPHFREMPDGTWRNSACLIDRQGTVAGVYNKNHVTIDENSLSGVLYGKDAPVFECDFGRVAFAICFDLNFDELRLKYVQAKPDLLLFCSMFHGGLVQNYWAYSCRAHFVGAIGGGEDGSILSPLGEVIAQTNGYCDFITARVNLDCRLAHLDYNVEKLSALKAKYGSKVTIQIPGRLGSVLISSETSEIDVLGMVREFGIELLDDYFQRALRHRHTAGHIECS